MDKAEGGSAKSREKREVCQKCQKGRGLCFVDTWGRDVPHLVVEHVAQIITQYGARGVTERQMQRGAFFTIASPVWREAVAQLVASGQVDIVLRTGVGRPTRAWVAV